jgi:hypothetical protein
LGVIGGAVTVYRQILQTLDNRPENKNDSANGNR